MDERRSTITRETKETSISLALNLDGQGVVSVDTGWGFADHMLTLTAFWAGFDLELSCKGDVHVDAHHSMEDIGLTLGRAFYEALGDKKGINRIGFARVPMDEAMAEVALDISGRPYLVYDDGPLPGLIAGEEGDVWREFFKSLAFKAQMNLHIRYLYGKNSHHLLESACKGLGLSLAQGAALRHDRILSTKGCLE
ncbi:MAG: imidazoleglycerol-phosphate dehydratase HisB [Desulfohalobiaceae bacterium]